MHNVKHKIEKILLNFVHIIEPKAKVEKKVKGHEHEKKGEDKDNENDLDHSSSKSEFSILPSKTSIGSFAGDTVRGNDNDRAFNIDTNLYLKMFIHELRLPISTLSIGIDVLEKTEQSDQNHQVLKDMKREILFLNDIFSKFAMIQNGNITLNPFSAFSMKTFFKGLETSLQYLFANAKTFYECKIHEDVYDWNYGDKYNLLHCFIHLLKNAVKYRSNDHGSLVHISVKLHAEPLSVTLTANAESLENEIKLKKKDRLTSIAQNGIRPSAPTDPAPSSGRRASILSRTLRQSSNNLNETAVQVLQFSVTDNNDPITSHIKDHLFEPFNSTSGSGLGLYICKNIVELHGGTITHHCSQTRGNEFRIILPLKKHTGSDMHINVERDKSSENFRHHIAHEPRIPEENIAKYNVLFVDESILNRKMACKILKTCGYFNTVRTAENGSDAIERVIHKLDEYDVIFIDRNLSKINGMDAAKIIRGLKYKNLIIGMSGEDNRNVDKLFLENGADYVFVKPLDNDKVTLIVELMNEDSSTHKIDKNLQLIEGKLVWV
jgi:signal transduction histidine kinase/AmiR/NasT family two-component response regulator